MISTKKSEKNPQIKGSEGEGIAEKFLKSEGFSILERNFRCKGGELDLVAEKGKEIHFIEVKYRSSHAYGEPLESIHWGKRKKISHAAQYYVLTHPWMQKRTKVFSVISVDSTRQPAKIELIENAFEVAGDYY